MQFEQRPSIKQQQTQRLSPQMIQSIQLMELPLTELKTRIQEELERNPALEIIEEAPSTSLDEYEERPAEETYFDDTSDPGFSGQDRSGDREDTKRKFLEGALSRPESLHDHLHWQLRLQPIDEHLFAIGELIINNLDSNGFHLVDPYSLIPESEHPELDRILDIIHHFDPVGVAVNDYRESLLVQAEINGDAPDGTVEVIRNHLDTLERGKLQEIARRMQRKQEKIEFVLEYLKTLDPFPGRRYFTEETQYVVPDLMVTIKEGEFVIILNDEEFPVLGIDPYFSRLATSGESEKSESTPRLKNYVQKSINEARWFIQTIQQRNNTLLKVARAIVEFQREFFLHGPKKLVPLTLNDIANEIGVVESTVSRSTNGKYMQTEWGIFELKYFFSNAIGGISAGGTQYSKQSVKEIIREIIEGEAKHLSDQKITDMLKARGIDLARRTVAKYRKELDIMSSYDR